MEIDATNIRIANSINVIENTGPEITAELFLTGSSTAQSAPLSGVDLWRLNVFTSSDGISKDGGINFLHSLSALQVGQCLELSSFPSSIVKMKNDL